MEQPFFSHDKLTLFDLENFALKQSSPTDSCAAYNALNAELIRQARSTVQRAISMPSFANPTVTIVRT
jgi:hypothetical protein